MNRKVFALALVSLIGFSLNATRKDRKIKGAVTTAANGFKLTRKQRDAAEKRRLSSSGDSSSSLEAGKSRLTKKEKFKKKLGKSKK